MFDRAFMRSKKVQALIRDHRLAYASILPFLDREGRIIAEPLVLKATVFRHSDFTLPEIASAVRALAGVGLIALYADEDNDAILQYVKFHEFNTPNSKEAKSDLPAPDDAGVMPCRDPSLTDAQATHVQSACNAGGERNGTSTLTTTNNGSTPSSTDLATTRSATPTRAHPQAFLDTWNEHRGQLPAVQTMNRKRRDAVGQLVKEHDGEALALFRDATLAVAGDDFWLERQYGFDNLVRPGRVLEKAEKYRAGGTGLGDARLRMLARASRWAAALPDEGSD